MTTPGDNVENGKQEKVAQSNHCLGQIYVVCEFYLKTLY